MMGLNNMAWLALLVWVVIPGLAWWMFIVLPKRIKTSSQRKLVKVTSIGVLIAPWLISTGVKSYYDQQVIALCDKDGGVKVYENVELPAERFNERGQILVSDEKNNLKWNTDFFKETIHQDLKTGNPDIWRLHFKIFRKADRKLLGETVSYARVGGDLPGPWSESSFGCPDNADITNLNEQIFTEIKE